MLVVDVYNHRFHKIFSPNDLLTQIMDRDDIFVYAHFLYHISRFLPTTKCSLHYLTRSWVLSIVEICTDSRSVDNFQWVDRLFAVDDPLFWNVLPCSITFG